MSRAPVLVEGRNLALREGTGIATYARTLSATLTGLGFECDVLFDTGFPLAARRPDWNEIRLYDHGGRGGSRPSPLALAARALDAAAASPFGVAAREIGQSGGVIDAGLFPGLGGFATRQGVERLFERADRHLLRYGRRLPVTPLRRPSVFHATHPAPVQVAGCANVYTIHDLVPLRLPHATLDNKRTVLKALREIARTADRIVTVSEQSRRDIVELLQADEARVVNTYQAVSLPPRLTERPREEAFEEIAAFGLEPGGYFLFLGAIEPKKNVARLIDAYLSSGTRRPLVIAGKLGWSYEPVVARIDMLAERNRHRPSRGRGATPPREIVRLSYLPLHQVVSLLRGARALLFPSLYEGFGLPALEAMLLGTPVLASDVSSLPEIVGEAGLLVDPYDPLALARAIRRLDRDDDLCAELAARGPIQAARFSPERYAERLSALYDTLV